MPENNENNNQSNNTNQNESDQNQQQGFQRVDERDLNTVEKGDKEDLNKK